PVPCVVKTIIEGIDADLDMQEMFLDEARICSHMRHPNVVSIMDVGRTTNRLYLTLEWIDGIDASNLINLSIQRKKGVPFKHVLYIIREALKGLHHAHTALGPDGQPLNIVHRDISPGNILISRQGAVKLADFGVALGRAAQNTEAQNARMGKPTYMAPEIWRDKPASIQTDIYAMGVTLYELLTSQPLFRMKDSVWAVAIEIASFDPKTILEGDLTLPEGIENILLNSLAPDPANRYQSALEFLEDVNDFCYETGIRLLDVHFATYIERMMEYRERLKAERKKHNGSLL
ncbi:MAG: serine/threonine-protein kinase, partial [Myxococcota bacterium]